MLIYKEKLLMNTLDEISIALPAETVEEAKKHICKLELAEKVLGI